MKRWNVKNNNIKTQLDRKLRKILPLRLYFTFHINWFIRECSHKIQYTKKKIIQKLR